MSLYVDIEKRLGTFRLQSKFEVADETLALLGASGCGKSVTLKCIAGIMTPDRGHIVLNDRVLFDSEKKIDLTPQQRRVGYLFQQYALFPNMTVEQNILCGIRAGSRSEKRALAAEKIRMFRLEGLEKKHPAQLSGGQQQRVALARILCSEPQAILLDEPFSALDSYLKWNLELELSDLLAGFRGPILWVSHDLGECCRNCQKVCVMENGVSSSVTDMETLVRHPATQSAARLTGCRNFLPARRCEGGVRLDGWDILLLADDNGLCAERDNERTREQDGADNAVRLSTAERRQDKAGHYIDKVILLQSVAEFPRRVHAEGTARVFARSGIEDMTHAVSSGIDVGDVVKAVA